MFRICSLLAAVFFSGLALAHHSTIAIYDSSQSVEITGSVRSVSWRNPHGQIILDAEDESGQIVQWEVETAAVSVLRIRGLDQDLIAVGDRITIAGSPARRSINEMAARNILLPSGYELAFNAERPHFPAGKNGNLISRVYDQSNVQAAIASADGIFRTWSTVMSDPAAFPMFKGGYPLTEAAEQVVANWNPLDNKLLRCGTKGTPLIMITPATIDFVHDGDDILMRIEEYDVRRRIHMSDDAIEPDQHTQFGFSRGRWEGTTLVVATDHISAQDFDPDGVPQSEHITVVERFMPDDAYDRLDYRITITDPIYFTEPFDLTRYFVWRPEMTVKPYECLERE